MELAHFKSFGSTTTIPLLPGFTVISGPNGSGKSNLLDALLFALGLSGSKGMRADRLPDLVNHSQIKRGHAIAETRVTVTFDLEEFATDPEADQTLADGEDVPADREFQVTRRLRVTKQGTYTSTYAMNGEPCTLTQLHEQLNRLRVYPEGYNVVLQGDVTSIISMNARQRREIIDELAGVAAFDRKIVQARDKLDAVKDQEDRFRIVEQELLEQRDRLARDRIQAEKYQALRSEYQAKSTWEAVLALRALHQQIQQQQQQLASEATREAELHTQIQVSVNEIAQISATLAELNAKVKALGEEEHLAVQAQMVRHETELRQCQQQQAALAQAQQAQAERIQQLQAQMGRDRAQLTTLAQQQHTLETQDLQQAQAQCQQAQQTLEDIRTQAGAIAATANAWVQQQTQLTQALNSLLQTLEPQRAEQAQLQERVQQLQRQAQSYQSDQQQLNQDLAAKEAQLNQIQTQVQTQQTQVQALATAVTTAEQNFKTLQETQARVLREQRDQQRQLDKLEAQQQAQQEAQGTYATRVILKAKLAGVCGLVAELGQVAPEYQTALEIAAGARLGHLVVEDDQVAAAGIELLKRERAGRATFLPLNKIQPPRSLPPLHAEGAIDYALALIEFEPRYRDIFAYVFGSTVVFGSLQAARQHLGRYRMVTLEGDLLESTGAMTGGSRSTQTTLHFGTATAGESTEVKALKSRLQDIDTLLGQLEQRLSDAEANLKQQTQALTTSRQQHRETQLSAEQLQREVASLAGQCDRAQQQHQTTHQEVTTAQARLHTLQTELPHQETQLAHLRQQLAELEQSQTHGEWQQLQSQIQQQEAIVQQQQDALRAVQQHIQVLEREQQTLEERIQQGQAELESGEAQHCQGQQQQTQLTTQQHTLQTALEQLRTDLAALEETLGAEKQARDRVEQQLRTAQTTHQEQVWQQQKLQESQQHLQAQLSQLQGDAQAQAADLPQPLPEVPTDLTLEALQQTLRSLQKRMQALEPVNMLAIEEYDRTQARLDELTQKLTTLEQERTELLLRIENFTTLRLQAFREAFDAVNTNFQTIFAELSDGDGYLQLENPEDPFQGGLNLVAHPKGKPVQRLASMSGGEKSLTALSFIFALQRYRPSPFYAFDEVDMFLDGANVERLSQMIQKQAQQAQFMVVSLRRPMIEASDRTIGVTQARGTHTQVIGLQLRPTTAKP
nr:chromosome segregation protein SMC [Petrachloros mirabilis]